MPLDSAVIDVPYDAPYKPEVFVVNDSGLDYSPAEKYGDLVYLTKGITNLSKLPEIRKRILLQIEHSNHGDYLLWSGQNLICAIALHIWLQIHGKCNLLLYKKEGNTYNEYLISD